MNQTLPATVIPADAAIARVRRDIAFSLFMRGVMIVAIVACMVFAPASARFAALAGVIGLWIGLSITSARNSQLAIESPSLIARGQFDEAERQINLAVRAFTLFGPAKLRVLHQLAVLRQAQRRWPEAAALCRAVLRQQTSATRQLANPSGLILAGSLLELNDLPGAYAAITQLYQRPLSLDETLNLLPLQLDYESRIGAFGRMFEGAAMKVQLAELLPSEPAATVQALLSLAADKSGRHDFAAWLRYRAQLLCDPAQLVAAHPLLGEVWKPASAGLQSA